MLRVNATNNIIFLLKGLHSSRDKEEEKEDEGNRKFHLATLKNINSQKMMAIPPSPTLILP